MKYRVTVRVEGRFDRVVEAATAAAADEKAQTEVWDTISDGLAGVDVYTSQVVKAEEQEADDEG